MKDSALSQEALGWLAEAFAQRLSEALEIMTGEAPQVAWRAADVLEAGSDALWWEQSLNFDAQSTLWVGASEAAWRELGQQVLRAAGIQSPEAAELQSSYLELVGQALQGVAEDLTARLERDAKWEGGRLVPGPPQEAWMAVLEVTAVGSQPWPVWLVASRSLLDVIERRQAPQQPGEPAVDPALEVGPAETSDTSLPPPQAEPRRLADGSAKTWELLMEVELPVSVSFGRTQLPLHDLLRLSTGSIIELDRSVNEPVEIIVNNCVIARGEVVVIEGNYGVRIQEIISRQDRLRTLN